MVEALIDTVKNYVVNKITRKSKTCPFELPLFIRMCPNPALTFNNRISCGKILVNMHLSSVEHEIIQKRSLQKCHYLTNIGYAWPRSVSEKRVKIKLSFNKQFCSMKLTFLVLNRFKISIQLSFQIGTNDITFNFRNSTRERCYISHLSYQFSLLEFIYGCCFGFITPNANRFFVMSML